MGLCWLNKWSCWSTGNWFHVERENSPKLLSWNIRDMVCLCACVCVCEFLFCSYDDQICRWLYLCLVMSILSTMVYFWQPLGNEILAHCVFFLFIFESWHRVAGEEFLAHYNVSSVLNTMKLQCNEIASRSSLELAAACVSQDVCLGMKSSQGSDKFGMICSCPNGPTWPGPTDTTFMSTFVLRSQKDVTLPGE